MPVFKIKNKPRISRIKDEYSVKIRAISGKFYITCYFTYFTTCNNFVFKCLDVLSWQR